MRKWTSALLLLLMFLVTAHAATAQVQVTQAYVYGAGAQRTATYPTGFQNVGTVFVVQNPPANSTWKLSYYNPGGSLVTTASGAYNNPAPQPGTTTTLAQVVPRGLVLTTGDWHIQIAINGQTGKDIYFSAGLDAVVFNHAIVIGSDFLTEKTVFNAGNNLIGSTAYMSNIAAGSWARLRYQRPDGSIAADNTYEVQNSSSYNYGSIGAHWFVNLNQTGTWHILYDLNGRTLTTEEFYVGQAPVGVEIDDRGGYGLTFGDVLGEVQTSPLQATLSLHSDLKLWLGITDIQATNGAKFTASTYSPGRFLLAKAGLVAPSVGPAYDASFPLVGSSVTMRVNMTPLAAELNIFEILLQAADSPVSADDIASDLDDVTNVLSQISAIKKAASHFSPTPPGRAGWLRAAAAAVPDLLSLTDTDKALLKGLVEQITYGEYTLDVERLDQLLNPLKAYFLVKFLLTTIADELTLILDTQGDDMVVTFTGSPLRQ